jgi:iron complex outermembrane receptor protein
MTRTLGQAWVALACASALVSSLAGQTGVTLSGRLVNALSGEPVGELTVSLEELRRDTRAAADGTFRFEAIPPGEYHLSVSGPGFTARRTEVTVGSSPVTVDVPVTPQIHFTEVLSVSPEPRSQIESYQPTTVLAGQDLAKQLETSLGATLETQPGVASRSFGPAPSRPVIRGLDGDRVLILQDGQRTGDLSSQSGDHGVRVNPASARRIEVVRGPATLLYGANAIGGLVNVITDEVPTRPLTQAEGSLTLDGGTAAAEGGGAGDVRWGNGRVAIQAGGGARRSGDVSTPEGSIDNSQSRSGFGNLGASWTGADAYVGASYGYDDSKYGVPVVEEGTLQLTPRRHAFNVKAGASGLDSIFDSLRAQLGVRRYRHEELEGADVGTRFTNNTVELETLLGHRAVGRLKGSVGGAALARAFDARGDEALSPAVNQGGFAAFVYEEVAWPHVTVQFGGRVERTEFEPAGEPTRRFTNVSSSVGLLLRPPAADDVITIAASLARAARNPALEELFFYGVHHGNFAFEIGNPGLTSEKALGFDLALRFRTDRASGEVAYFRNDVDDFIFRNLLTEEAFEAREQEFEARFPGRTVDHGAHGHGDAGAELPFVEFAGADSVLQGVEAHADLRLTPSLIAELGVDFVRGTVKATGDPLPRLPPFRVRGGLRYQRGGLQTGGEIIGVADQNRVIGAETPTEGYGLLRLFAAYAVEAGGALHTITARLDNATNTLYRNHLSLIKEFVPEMGRNAKLLYTVRF